MKNQSLKKEGEREMMIMSFDCIIIRSAMKNAFSNACGLYYFPIIFAVLQSLISERERGGKSKSNGEVRGRER